VAGACAAPAGREQGGGASGECGASPACSSGGQGAAWGRRWGPAAAAASELSGGRSVRERDQRERWREEGIRFEGQR